MSEAVPANIIDDASISRLVRAFYAKVRKDPDLDPIFEAAIGDNWDHHLERMTDFWSSVMLTSGRYSGNPMIKHVRQKAIRPEHFVRWLALFEETVGELFTADCAAQFAARAHNIARGLQMGMFFMQDAHKAQCSA